MASFNGGEPKVKSAIPDRKHISAEITQSLYFLIAFTQDKKLGGKVEAAIKKIVKDEGGYDVYMDAFNVGHVKDALEKAENRVTKKNGPIVVEEKKVVQYLASVKAEVMGESSKGKGKSKVDAPPVEAPPVVQ